MKKTLVSLAVVLGATALPSVSFADLAYNVGVVSDYRYRGISQSRLKPALQGGVDWSAGALYAGAWASTIQWIKDAGGGSDLEVDLYGGVKGEVVKGLAYDVGALYYWYPGHDLSVSPNTGELYGALTWGPATLKYSHSLTNLFGFADSKNSQYIDLTIAIDLGSGWTLTPHVGRQLVNNNNAAAYTDASLGLSKDMGGGLVLSAVAVDAKTGAYFGKENKDLGKRSIFIGAKYSF